MRTLTAVTFAFSVAIVGVFLLMPAMSNGGLLSGYEFFGMLAVSALCVAGYYLVARRQAVSRAMLWVQAAVVGISAPFVVLLAPLAFCLAFRAGASCV